MEGVSLEVPASGFETRSLLGLELTNHRHWLASETQKSTCLCLFHAGSPLYPFVGLSSVCVLMIRAHVLILA